MAPKSLRCLECGKLTGADRRRGLCRPCYRNPEIREEYITLPRGAWTSNAKVWDITDDALLIDLFEDGFSDRQIAKQMGRSIQGVTNRRQKLGLKVSPQRQATHR